MLHNSFYHTNGGVEYLVHFGFSDVVFVTVFKLVFIIMCYMLCLLPSWKKCCLLNKLSTLQGDVFNVDLCTIYYKLITVKTLFYYIFVVES